MNIGVDLVPIARIENNDVLVQQILTQAEQVGKNLQSLAGKIAAKEALVKCGVIAPGEWHTVQILNETSGKPQVCDSHGKKILGLEVSISHTDDLAIAVVVYD